ncbi:hypothetical protein [Spongiactinospora sp. 9N601]|uniref:hypothetical protein n=1 Tax=Spongiactinospora sp. 9N601 TaxID=3375149 RepID=UPI003787D5EA
MQVPRFLPALRTRFLPKAAAVAALATVLTTAGFGAADASSTGSAAARWCKSLERTDTKVVITCAAENSIPYRVGAQWCSSGFNCDTVLGNWASNGALSTAYHPGGKYFSRWWTIWAS